MKATAAKIVMRTIGTLIALWGLVTLCAVVVPTLAFSDREHTWVLWPIVLALLPLVIWFAYVGYLVWTSFSPLVVRHVWGAIVFLCFLFIPGHMVTGTQADIDSPWLAPAFIGLFVAACAIHRIVSKQLNHWLFPEFG